MAETPFTVGENDTEKAIAVTLTYKTTEPSGDGTVEFPILIGTAAELRAFANKVNSGDSAAAHAYVKLTDNIKVWVRTLIPPSAATLTATAKV